MFRFGEEHGPLKCSFCGKLQISVFKLIAGPGVYICDECVGLCDEIISEEHKRGISYAEPPPFDIASAYDSLSSQMVCQHLEGALRDLLRTVSRHRGSMNARAPSPHILLSGESGSGKTTLVRALQKALPFPVAVLDASSIIESSYYGIQLTDLRGLLETADYDLVRAQRGMIVLDNFDHLYLSHQEHVQWDLLSRLDGTVVQVRTRTSVSSMDFDTNSLLYLVCMRDREQAVAPPLAARFPVRIRLGAPDLQAIMDAEGGAWVEYVSWLDRDRGLAVSPGARTAAARGAARLGLNAHGISRVIARIDAYLGQHSVPVVDTEVVEAALATG